MMTHSIIRNIAININKLLHHTFSKMNYLHYFVIMHLRQKKMRFMSYNISLLIERKTNDFKKIDTTRRGTPLSKKLLRSGRSYLLWAYLGVRTSELLLCFAPFVFLGSSVLTSLFHVTRTG